MYQKIPRHQELENNLRNTTTILHSSFIDNLLLQINKIAEAAYDQARKQYDAEMANVDLDLFRSVKHIISDHSGVDIEMITLDSRFIEDFGMDSLDTVELCMMLEEEFQIEVPDEDAQNIYTVRDLMDYLHNHNVKVR